MAAVAYFSGSKDVFAPSAATSMNLNLSNANVDPVADNAPNAYLFVVVSMETTTLTGVLAPTLTVDGTAMDVQWGIWNSGSRDGHQAIAMVAIPDGGFSPGVVNIAWSTLVPSGTSVKASANVFYNIDSASAAFGSGYALSTAGNQTLGPFDVPEDGAVFVSNMQWTGGDVDALVKSSVDAVAYTMQSPDVIVGISYYMTGYRLFTAVAPAESVTPSDDAYDFRPAIGVVLAPFTPVASFTADPTAGTEPLEVTFTNTSVGGATFDWDFGDGSAHSTEESPTHEYAQAGDYTVTLTLNGDATLTATTDITVTITFNCECEEETDNETLGQLRRRLLVRLGYSAQADNPPPGMADLLDDFLVQAQRFLYRRYRALRTERFFSWPMTVGQRMYDLPDNDETCTKKLDPYKLSWVGVEDLNGAWYRLVEGIPPEFYTSVNFQGIPARYEIRQCIEVFPAPSAEYTLRIKGHFGLTSFVEDDDKTTVDSELVFMWALANAKAHYQQPDASSIAGQATTYLGTLVAGAHGTTRYVPGTRPAEPWTPPVFLPLIGE